MDAEEKGNVPSVLQCHTEREPYHIGRTLRIALVVTMTLCATAIICYCLSKRKRPVDFPMAITAQNGQIPVQAVKAFIDERYTILNHVAGDYCKYMRIVQSKGEDREELSRLLDNGRYFMLLDGEDPARATRESVDAFEESPEGAYLSEQDKLFIKRYLNRAEANIRMLVKTGMAHTQADVGKTEGTPTEGIRQEFFADAFHGACGAKLLLDRIPPALLERIARRIRENMVREGHSDLWDAYRKAEASCLVVRKDDAGNSIDLKNFAARAVEECIQTQMGSSRRSDMRIFQVLLKQAYTAYPFGQVLVSLDEAGVNAYIGDERLERLNTLVISSLRKAAELDSTTTTTLQQH